jgi:chitinase
MSVSIARALLLAAVALLAVTRPAEAEVRIVAYVIGWENPPAIDPDKLTHINYAFGKIEGGKVVFPHAGVPHHLAHLRSLKAKNPRLKVLLSVGGSEASNPGRKTSRTSPRCCEPCASTSAAATC